MKLTEENRSIREKKPVPVPLCPPQIPHGLTPGSNPGRRGERAGTNRLSHGTAKREVNFQEVNVLWHLLGDVTGVMRVRRQASSGFADPAWRLLGE
jgi:hypothetical protein